MFIMSQDRRILQEMTGKSLIAFGSHLTLCDFAGKVEVGTYETDDECQIAIRLIEGAMQAKPNEMVIEVPLREELTVFREELNEGFKRMQKEFRDKRGRDPETMEEFIEMFEKELKEEK